VLLGRLAHGLLVEGVEQAVVEGRVEDLGVAVAVADRAFGSRYGAWVIDSMPPATTTSNSPARISWSAMAIASGRTGRPC
jgi:hypothetical protein